MLYKKQLITMLIVISLLSSGAGSLTVFADEIDGATPDTTENTAAEQSQEIEEISPDMSPGNSVPVMLPFTDISADDWYYPHISTAYSLGIINGVSEDTFSPDSSLTGAEFLTMLCRADGSDTTSGSGLWYDAALEWAETNSILTDTASFDPESALSREDMMVFLYRYLLYKNIELETSSDLSAFTDVDEISSDALAAVELLVGEGIIEGDGTTLRPQDELSRAETAAILIRALELTGKTGEDSPNSSDGAPGLDGSDDITQGTSANTIYTDSTISDTSYTSIGNDENALRITGASVTLENITVDKSSGDSSDTEDGDFYGQNAALLATDGAHVTITDSEVSSSATNGSGVFSYGEGTSVNISDTVINTIGDHSGGIQTTGGASMTATDLTITTAGSSSAAIRTDRGGGTVTVEGGTYTTNGYNSPAVYSTADITISDAELTANNSEALIIEGKNSITLKNCDVSGNMSDTEGTSSDENVHNVMIYQSMSGDAEVGTSSFSMTGGILTGNNGDMFYITNTNALITLSDVDIRNNDEEAYLFLISGNSGARGWGTAGENGAQAEITADSQTMEGNIAVDTISTLELDLTNGSTFTGTINIIDNEESGTASDNNANVVIDSDSTWILTGNCTLSTLENNGTIDYNGYTITLADGTVLSE